MKRWFTPRNMFVLVVLAATAWLYTCRRMSRPQMLEGLYIPNSKPSNAITEFEISYRYDRPNKEDSITKTSGRFIEVYFVPWDGRPGHHGCNFGNRPEMLNDSNSQRVRLMQPSHFKLHENQSYGNEIKIRWDTNHGGAARLTATIKNNIFYDQSVKFTDGAIGWPNYPYMKSINVDYHWLYGSGLTKVEAKVKINGRDLDSWNRDNPQFQSKIKEHGAPQTYDWKTGGWTSCQGSCDSRDGKITRDVTCVSSKGQTSSESLCTKDKPATEKPCNYDCPSNWQPLPWGACTPKNGLCGPGMQSRDVVCKSDAGNPVSESWCSGSKPTTQQDCKAKECTEWHTGDWRECEVDQGNCGRGENTRDVSCRVTSTGATTANGDCKDLPQDRPVNTKQCRVDCPTYKTKWENGWSQCDSDCGPGMKTRIGNCVNETGELVDQTLCKGPMQQTKQCEGTNCVYVSEFDEWSQCRAANGACGPDAGTTTRNHECYSVTDNGARKRVDPNKCGDWRSKTSSACDVECEVSALPIDNPYVEPPGPVDPPKRRAERSGSGSYVWSNPEPICTDQFGQSPICYPSVNGGGLAEFDAEYSMNPDTIYCMDRNTGSAVDGKLCKGEKPTRCTPETMPGLNRCRTSTEWRRMPTGRAGSGALGTSDGRNLAQTDPVRYARSMLGLPSTMSNAEVQNRMRFQWNTDDTWDSCVGQTCADVGGGVHKMKGGTRSRDVLCDLILTDEKGATLPIVNTHPTHCPVAKPVSTMVCGEGPPCDPAQAGRTAAEMLGQAPAVSDSSTRAFQYERPLEPGYGLPLEPGFAWSQNSQNIDFPGDTPSRWFSDKTAGRGRGKLNQMFGNNFPEWKDKYGEDVKPASTEPGMMYKVDLESTLWKDCKLKSGSDQEIEECYLDRVGIMPANSVLSGY